jgi:hypothetical protein
MSLWRDLTKVIFILNYTVEVSRSTCPGGKPNPEMDFKLLRSPGIDSKESNPPAYVAWRAGIRQPYSSSVLAPIDCGEHSRKEPFEQLIYLLFGTSTSPSNTGQEKIKIFNKWLTR